jgi:hypothetical protein
MNPNPDERVEGVADDNPVPEVILRDDVLDVLGESGGQNYDAVL